MENNKWVTRFDTAHGTFVQGLYYCTSEDTLIWKTIDNTTDCEYIAEFESREFRLGCNHRKSYFFIDNKPFPLHWRAKEVLCQLISQQRIRLKNKTKELEEINHLFEKALSGRPLQPEENHD